MDRRKAETTPWRVSVIIPAYQAAETIPRAIRSVLHQTYPATEILVIDDGSPDDIEAAVRPFGSQIQLIRQPNGGAARARNTGLDHARGDLIAFLDADDYWEPHKLEQHVELYRNNPRLGLTCSRYFEQEPLGPRREVSLNGAFACDQELKLSGQEAFEFGCKVWTGTVVVRRRTLREARFTTELKTAEDRHLWIRLVTAAPVYCLSQPLATAVLEPDSLSRSDIDDDCANMFRVVYAYQDLLGTAGVREWEAHVYRRLAGVHLAAHRPRQAVRPALAYLRRKPHCVQGWWALLKSSVLSLVTRPQSSAGSVTPAHPHLPQSPQPQETPDPQMESK